MGLDSVELVMEIEDEFGIRIPDADAEQLWTIGSIVRYVARRQGLHVPVESLLPDWQPERHCFCLPAFHAVRRVLMNQFGVARGRIRLDQRLVTLIPSSGWRRLENRLALLGVTRSRFRFPGPGVVFVTSLAALAIAIGVYTTVLVATTSFMTPLLAWNIVGAVATATVIAMLVRRRFVTNSTLLATIVRDVAVDMQSKAWSEFLEHKARAARENETRIEWRAEHESAARLLEIRSKVHELVAQQYGVPCDSLTDATSIGDLER